MLYQWQSDRNGSLRLASLPCFSIFPIAVFTTLSACAPPLLLAILTISSLDKPSFISSPMFLTMTSRAFAPPDCLQILSSCLAVGFCCINYW